MLSYGITNEQHVALGIEPAVRHPTWEIPQQVVRRSSGDKPISTPSEKTINALAGPNNTTNFW